MSVLSNLRQSFWSRYIATITHQKIWYLGHVYTSNPAKEWCWFMHCVNEPRHDKTNKVSVRQAKTKISLGIRPVWLVFSLSAWRNVGPLPTLERTAKTLIRLGGCPGWSESSLGAHSLCWFCHVATQVKMKAEDHLTCVLNYPESIGQ